MQGLQLQYLPVAPSPPPLALRRKASNYRTWIKSTTLPMPRTWIKSTSRRSLYVIRGRGALTIPNSGSSCPPSDSGNSSPSGYDLFHTFSSLVLFANGAAPSICHCRNSEAYLYTPLYSNNGGNCDLCTG
ncbi:uncharacterized protein [Coffea arabica]|uniref:Uncharacterized protein n=1 Tax=Coffea arabica TaxID=13443 RepID=A0A6P6VBT5_COFAR|nr:uncharacterized protein LOC113719218 [Coffea arabica]